MYKCIYYNPFTLRATPLISAIYVILFEIKKKTKGKTKISPGKEWQTNCNEIMLKFNLSEQNNGGMLTTTKTKEEEEEEKMKLVIASM